MYTCLILVSSIQSPILLYHEILSSNSRLVIHIVYLTLKYIISLTEFVISPMICFTKVYDLCMNKMIECRQNRHSVEVQNTRESASKEDISSVAFEKNVLLFGNVSLLFREDTAAFYFFYSNIVNVPIISFQKNKDSNIESLPTACQSSAAY